MAPYGHIGYIFLDLPTLCVPLVSEIISFFRSIRRSSIEMITNIMRIMMVMNNIFHVRKMSKLTRDECTSMFKAMADSKDLAQKYRELYRIMGQGVWLLHGTSGDQLRVMKPTMAVYVPMDSLPMFFLSPTLTSEKVDPNKEMLLALQYGSSYLWAKVIIPSPQVQQVRSTRVSTPAPQSVRTTYRPNPTPAPSTLRNAAILSRRR